MDTQLDFGQAEGKPLVVHGDTVTAGERELEAAAEGKSMDRRDRRARQRLEAIEDFLAGADQPIAVLGILDCGELLDVRARHEATLLGGDEDHGPGRILCQRRQQAVELTQDAPGEHICGSARLVDRQPQDRVGVLLDAPGR